MNDERPDQMMMIGLHKLASQFGDGLVPELYELLTRRARMLEDNPGLAEFPARQPGRAPHGLVPSPEAVILPFPDAEARCAAQKKALGR
ncbi:hypothetical protein [Ensifer sp. LCM 4579]|uniref:hypothetical protein n=1 Tax=Ensifer sp. LCM 4579 TaxID=1848292 RepID=UPI0008DA63F9|nr:hypothetical protein [Ensifer sp. LCM 4579]OHV81407.1 hypothetical protein LCM4579_20005 [Ensifer sp. LCM 4579]